MQSHLDQDPQPGSTAADAEADEFEPAVDAAVDAAALPVDEPEPEAAVPEPSPSRRPPCRSPSPRPPCRRPSRRSRQPEPEAVAQAATESEPEPEPEAVQPEAAQAAAEPEPEREGAAAVAEPEPEPELEPEAAAAAAPEPEPEAPAAEPATVAELIAATLRGAGVRLAFTVPGESFLPVLDALEAAGIRIVATRHEGAAAFAAEAYGQLTGRPAACLGSRIVGASNLAIGIHTATADSTPMFALVGQVERRHRGREAFQESDLVGGIGSLAKWAGEIDDPLTAAATLEAAVHAVLEGRPGPSAHRPPRGRPGAPDPEGHPGAHRPAAPESHPRRRTSVPSSTSWPRPNGP